MSGLGDALGVVGQQMFGIAKEQRLNKLEKEKEERTEEREKAKEERQRLRDLNKVHGDPTIIERDGKKLYQYKNNEGGIINEEEVDPFTLTRLNREQSADQASLESTLLGNKKLQKELDYFDADHARDVEYDAARTGAENRRYTGTGTGGGRSIEGTLTPEDSPGKLTNILVKEYADLGNMYSSIDVNGKKIAEGDTTTRPAITEQEFRDIAADVVILAAKKGVDPRLSLQHAVKAFVRNKKKK